MLAQHDMWKDMFVMGLPLAEKILRPIMVYVFLILGLTVVGETGVGAD